MNVQFGVYTCMSGEVVQEGDSWDMETTSEGGGICMDLMDCILKDLGYVPEEIQFGGRGGINLADSSVKEDMRKGTCKGIGGGLVQFMGMVERGGGREGTLLGRVWRGKRCFAWESVMGKGATCFGGKALPGDAAVVTCGRHDVWPW